MQIHGPMISPPPSTFSTVALLDTGAPAIRFPFAAKDIVESLWESMSVRFNVTEELADIPVIYCSENVDISLTFTFGAAAADLSTRTTSITVPFHQLVIPLHRELNGQPLCGVQLSYISDPRLQWTELGIPFLNSAYVHYNIDEHTISLANPSYNSKKPDLVAIGKGRVPNLIGTG